MVLAIDGITDDSDFLNLINALLRKLTASIEPKQLWVIHIDNWFDHKWLKFSGNGAVSSNIPLEGFETVKKEFYQDRITFPPFAPNRVLGQRSYVRQDDAYREFPIPKLPHNTARLHTNLNLQRRIDMDQGSICFVWYSGNTLRNDKGSVMVYTIQRGLCDCWYAGFIRSQRWAVALTKGIHRDHVEGLVSLEP
jgi:hypothetical protein